MMTFVAGLGTALMLSIPFGPMGLTGALQAANGNRRGAWMLALGVCLADGLLAVFASYLIQLPPLILGPVGIMLMLMMVTQLLRQEEASPVLTSGFMSFGIGMGTTLTNMGNLMTFGLAFSGLHSLNMSPDDVMSYAALMVGVSLGAFMMWAGLILTASRLENTAFIQRWQMPLRYGMAALCLLVTGGIATHLFYV